jgi:hypothetical protein
MQDREKFLKQASLVMKIVGWLCVAGLPLAAVVYPPGILWGSVSPDICFPNLGPDHPPSPFHGLHPYFFMVAAMYVSLGLLLLKGARDPMRNVALFDYGIWSSIIHGGIMIPMAFYYPGEHAHLWADIPFAGIVMLMMWKWHPNKCEKSA